MNKCSDSIVLAEQQVAEARTAVLAECQAARAKLRCHMGSRSPVFIGGVLLGAIALGYLALGRGKPKRLVYQRSPGAWTRVGKTVQVLLPLLTALNSATKAAHRPRANISEAVM
jgi:hypothetical protein